MANIKNFTNLEGAARIFEKEITAKGKTFTVYNVAVSKKTDNGYVNASLDVNFSNAALKALAGIAPTKTEKATYYDVVVKGWLTVKTTKDGKNFVAVFVNEIA